MEKLDLPNDLTNIIDEYDNSEDDNDDDKLEKLIKFCEENDISCEELQDLSKIAYDYCDHCSQKVFSGKLIAFINIWDKDDKACSEECITRELLR
jgi:uncharacterized Fe-S center protein